MKTKKNTQYASIMPIILVLFIFFNINNVFGQSQVISSHSGFGYEGDIYHSGGNIGIGSQSPFYPITIMQWIEQGDTAYIRLVNSYPVTKGAYSTWDIGNVEDNLVFKHGFNAYHDYTHNTVLALSPTGQLSLGTETPDASAIMQMNSNDKGLLIPRMTTPEKNAISSPVNALLVFDTDLQAFSYYDTNAGEWLNIAETTAFSDYLLISDFNNSVAGGINETDTENWNSAYNWTQNFKETDPIFNSHLSSGITEQDTTNWNNAYNWTQNFSETDPIFNSHLSSGITEQDTANWNTAYNWGNHAAAGYLTDLYETDPIFSSHLSFNITEEDTTYWNTAYDWGNHATAGYITDGNTNWDNEYGFITASSSDELTNKTGNISMWTNDVGYITEASGTFLWGRQNNNTILLNSGDNLGLGTNNPKKSLHIYNHISEMGFNKSAIRLHNYYEIYGKGIDPPPPVVVSNAVWDIENNKNTLDFKFGHDALNYPVVTKISFDKDGKIGIGTSEPQTQLHIINEESSVIRLQTNYDNGAIPNPNDPPPADKGNKNKSLVPVYWDIRTEETTLHFDYTQNENYQASKIKFTKAGKINANQLNIANGNLTVDNKGNVGIGTDDPDAKIWVEGRCVIRQIDGDDALDVVNDAPKNSLSSNTDLIWGRYKYRQDNNPRLLHFSTWDEEKGSRDIFTIKNNGQVGIGTKNPTGLLTIYTDNNTNSNSQGMIQLSGSETNAQLRIGLNETYAWIQSHGSKPLRINELGNNTVLNLSGGNVGIGTDNPVAALDIDGDLNFTGMLLHDGEEFSPFVWQENENHIYYTGGNVGIGTDNPSDKLQVNSGITKLTVGSAYGSGTGWGEAYIGFNAVYDKNTQEWKSETDNANNGGSIIYTSVGGEIRFVSIPSTGNADSTENADQVITDAEMLNRISMTISKNGELKLKNNNVTNFHVKDDGYVYARELTVQLSGPLPDYVFEPEYKPMPLNELETYIKQNKHLPEVPSASEVAAEGIKIGEMNTILLKKIEELTLYTIEQEKKLEKKDKQFEELKGEIEELRELIKN